MRKAGSPHSVRIVELRAPAAADCLVPAAQRFSLAETGAAHRTLEMRPTVAMVVLKP
ncbi:hypothetical protein ACWGQ5_52635 [Streptomyces sp. NPDC055722]